MMESRFIWRNPPSPEAMSICGMSVKKFIRSRSGITRAATIIASRREWFPTIGRT